MSTKKLTPMLQQYFDLKQQHQDAFLFFRLGDFYELFGDNAVEASKLLGITLTARQKGTENEIAMCGVPHHSAQKYIEELISLGKKVALCEQVSDPSEKGIVEREVVKIITPGTTLDENEQESRYLAAVVKGKKSWGLAYGDLSTGEWELVETEKLESIQNILFQVQAKELLYEQEELKEQLASQLNSLLSPCSLQRHEDPVKMIQEQLGTQQLEAFGIQEKQEGLRAAAIMLKYLRDTQKSSLDHLKKITLRKEEGVMMMDESTIRNLELFSTTRTQSKTGSLFEVINFTKTRMGFRMLQQWLLRPLTKREEIEKRQQATAELCENSVLQESLQQQLAEMTDLERLVGKIGCRSVNARDLLFLKVNLEKIQQLEMLLQDTTSSRLQELVVQLPKAENLISFLQERIHPEAPVMITEGGMIADGFDAEIDELRSLQKNGKNWLLEYQEKLKKELGISTLKVKFNKVFGYHIEISKGQSSKVPENFHVKQTLVNAHRYTTRELDDFENDFLNSEERLKKKEYELFQEIINLLQESLVDIRTMSLFCAEVDCYQSFAKAAKANQYCLPGFQETGISIEAGRHPVIEQLLRSQDQVYIANDSKLPKEEKIVLLTGPNMAGKSSYLRQTALICLMAQMGSYVPAHKAHLPIIDRIFTRVGASDDLSRGQSTFMVEMIEAANILQNATDQSLIIFDELGRGTSTYDGVSLAWSILEHLANDLRAYTLFATHYHELIELADDLPGVRNASVSVKEEEGKIIFLHKVQEGAVDRSYGIEVAKKAGLPHQVIERAQQVLNTLEEERHHQEESIVKSAVSSQKTVQENPLQSSLFEIKENPKHRALVNRLENIPLNSMTPLEALNTLHELQQTLTDDSL